MIRHVLTYPDPFLKKVSRDVETFDTSLHTLLDDMYETMVEHNGVGLAAIQVGVDIRALVINIPDEEGNQPTTQTLEMLNPVLAQGDGEQTYQEGCLSIPEYYDDVIRYQRVTVTYHDRNGTPTTLEAEDFLAVVIQHEMDHLTGNLFVEKLPMLRRKKFEKEWKRKLKTQKHNL